MFCVKAHIQYVIVRQFVKYVGECVCEPAVKKVLSTLCQIYALYNIIENAGDFLQVLSLLSDNWIMAISIFHFFYFVAFVMVSRYFLIADIHSIVLLAFSYPC